MILAFMPIPGSAHPRLCIAADRPDQFSLPVPVENLVETEAAVLRLGPAECITVRAEPREGAVILAPLGAAKLYLTPNVGDRPGIHALRIKVIRKGEDRYETHFQQEREREHEWRRWDPNSMKS